MRFITKEELVEMYGEHSMGFIEKLIRQNNEYFDHCSDTKGYMLVFDRQLKPIPISDNGEIRSSALFVGRMLNGRQALIITKNRFIDGRFWPDGVSIDDRDRVSEMDHFIAMVHGIDRDNFTIDWVLDRKESRVRVH